ncbi:hypothetical protein AGMMS50229_03610 [Campylobacterota bacterium]|nr:hypothetical protein AGMMS50229_03610 [Campylobacterota bacterium]
MEATLTLKLDKLAIDSAKRYAKQHNRTLSRIVESYFNNLSLEYNYRKKHSPIVESLTGVLSENDLEKFAREDERARYILKQEI